MYDGNDGFDDYNYDDNDNNTEHDYMVEDHDAHIAALLIQPLVLYQHVIDELSHTGSLELKNHDETKQRVKRDDCDGVDRHWSYDDITEEQIDQNGGQTNAPKANLSTHQQEPDRQQQWLRQYPAYLAVVSQPPTCTLVIMMRHTLIAVTMMSLLMAHPLEQLRL
jgi:hypothetical protein